MIIKGNSVFDIPLKAKSVQTVIFSPPYFGQRLYGDSEQEYGQGSIDHYFYGWRTLMRGLHRVMRDDALLYFNVDDTANESGGAGGDYNSGGSKDGRPKWKQGATDLEGKQFLNIPARLAWQMQESGMWQLRQEIVWDKGKLEVCDGNHIRRPKKAMEKIYMFSKRVKRLKDYKFYFERLKEPGNVWHFAPNATGDKGYAPFPDELAERCILPSSDEGDIILDPFSGSGTTARVANDLGRVGIGIELYA